MKKKKTNRKVVVFVSLVGAMALTSALLLVLAPAPLTAESVTSLFAVDTPSSMDAIFETSPQVTRGHWRYIFIHHSRTLSGNAETLSQTDAGVDHFVIGNGDGLVDGEVQITQPWRDQESISSPPAGVSRMDPACISICLVGDFDRTRPTPTQERRLAQLVGSLQHRLGIPANRILTLDQPASPAGIGQSFPLARFKNQILP